MADLAPETERDIVIAGGGPAGSALALALADGRRRITVVEARATPPAGDTRATALSAGSIRLLDALGVWDELAPAGVPIRTVEVSQAGHFGRTYLRAGELGTDALGRVVAYDALARVLGAAARAAPGVEWIAPATAGTLEQRADAIELEIDGDGAPPTRRAALAVAAEGTRSPLRRAAGIATREHDYGQTALLAPIDAGGDPHTGYERFTRDGPMAVLPAGGRRRTLVWTLAPERAEATAALAPAEFERRAASLLGHTLAPVRLQGTPAAWPLRRIEAEHGWSGRVALVGNAARTLHPVGAQGFNLALRDVCGLAEALAEAADPGDPDVLSGWDRSRRGDRWRTRAFTDVLARGFVRGGRALAPVRAGALIGLDTCAPARRTLAAQTMGLLGGLPRVGRWRLGGRS